MSNQGELQNGLKSRHLTMISIAGVIGGALFVGSGNVIYNAGPAAILAYMLGGILVLLIMRMLGEMAIAKPDSGSFSTYADLGIGRWAGFTIGWLYWYFWALLMGWEAYVAGVILNGWFPEIPIWLYMIAVTVIFGVINFMNVKNYDEFEFWFALIKVVAIVIFLIVCSLAIIHIWPWGDTATRGIANLTKHGFMPNGTPSVVTAILIVMFSYMGAEIATIAAAESKIPEQAIRRATNSVGIRIIIFYVGSMFVAVCLVNYTDPRLTDPTWGTYSVTLDQLGIPYARTIVNFIVLTSVCSCFNSALYTCSRMLFSLSKRGDAHRSMSKLNKSGSPWVGVLVSCIFTIIAAILSALDKLDIYDVLMAATGTVSLYVYLAIAVTQLKLRRKMQAEGKELTFKMWCFPWLTYIVIAFIVISVAAIILYKNAGKQTEVLYTTLLAIIIVGMGITAQKYNIGKK